MNKVLYGIKNVHIAKLTEKDGEITYGTPFAMPGATGFSPDPQGDTAIFYADNKIYFRQDSNQGYKGDLVIAMTVEQFLTEILGRFKDANGAIIENSEDKQSRFALMFEADGDEKARRFVYWDCSASRPSREHSTKQETIEPGTESMAITIVPRSTDSAIGAYLERTEENKTAYDNFFKSVYEKAEPTETQEV